MKRIGFIDYFLDEWHANNYPAWIRDNVAKNGRKLELSFAWADTGKQGGLDTTAWCEKFGVKPLASIDELVEMSDYIIVLSPDNPEQHERLSALPLASGKPVYIDKTFSPDMASGVRMFNAAAKHNTPMFSSSALRFGTELCAYPDDEVNSGTIEYMATTGPGKFENYAVHQLEMIVARMGTGAKRIKSLSAANEKLLAIEYGDGRGASMLQMNPAPFQALMQLKSGKGVHINQCSDMFPRLIDAVLTFFETGKAPVPREETLEIMALIEAGAKAIKNYDTWIDVPR